MDTILAALEVVPEPFKSFASTLVDVCAYAGMCLAFSTVKALRSSSDCAFLCLGTGNVLKVQVLLHICSEHYESKDPVSASVTFALLRFKSVIISSELAWLNLSCLLAGQ